MLKVSFFEPKTNRATETPAFGCGFFRNILAYPLFSVNQTNFGGKYSGFDVVSS
jgi:hypothetical protein